MERAITASDANQRFSEMLREVQEGESFVVMSRGRPVAKVTPIDGLGDQARAIDDLLDHVGKLPHRHLSNWQREDLYD